MNKYGFFEEYFFQESFGIKIASFNILWKDNLNQKLPESKNGKFLNKNIIFKDFLFLKIVPSLHITVRHKLTWWFVVLIMKLMFYRYDLGGKKNCQGHLKWKRGLFFKLFHETSGRNLEFLNFFIRTKNWIFSRKIFWFLIIFLKKKLFYSWTADFELISAFKQKIYIFPPFSIHKNDIILPWITDFLSSLSPPS